MTFTIDTPMVFPILWVLPCVSATVGTMGFAMYTPMGIPILCVLQTALVQSMGLAYALIVAVDDDDNIFDLAMIDGDGDGDGDGD